MKDKEEEYLNHLLNKLYNAWLKNGKSFKNKDRKWYQFWKSKNI